MNVAVDRTAEMLSNQLRRLQVELEPADQIDVECVEIGEQRLEAEPAPTRHASTELFAAPLVALVVHDDSVVGMRHFDRSCSRSSSLEGSDKLARRVREIAPHFEDRHELPIRRQRCLERTERVSDAPPLLHRCVAGVTPVNHIPDETPHDADSPLAHHRASTSLILELTERLH